MHCFFPCPRHAAWFLLVLVPLLLAGPLTARGDDDDIEQRKRNLILKLKVQRAIGRGGIWLAKQQHKDGSFRLAGNAQQGPFPQSRHRFGESALATLTLAHCGYDSDDSEIKRAVAYLRKHYRSYFKGDFWPQASTYSLSIVVLALHEIYARDPEDDLAGDRSRYGSSVRREKNPCRYPQWARVMIEKILDWVLENRAEEGLFRYPHGLPNEPQGPRGAAPGAPGGGPGGPGRGFPGMPMRGPNIAGPEDLSNTQYALLALWAGSRCGYVVEKEVLEAIARRLLEIQQENGRTVRRVLDPSPDAEQGKSRYGDMTRPKGVRDRARGFGYTPGDRATGSMTTAGLSSLAIVKAMLLESHRLDPDLRKALDQGIWDAIAWLDVHFDVHGNPPMRSPVWHYYYLYGLERAGVLAGKRFLGDHDWYREGAQMLVDAQEEGGRWAPESAVGGWGGPGFGSVHDTSMLDTCFALLFLKRATMRPKEPLLREPVVTPDDDTTPEPQR